MACVVDEGITSAYERQQSLRQEPTQLIDKQTPTTTYLCHHQKNQPLIDVGGCGLSYIAALSYLEYHNFVYYRNSTESHSRVA